MTVIVLEELWIYPSFMWYSFVYAGSPYHLHLISEALFQSLIGHRWTCSALLLMYYQKIKASCVSILISLEPSVSSLLALAKFISALLPQIKQNCFKIGQQGHFWLQAIPWQWYLWSAGHETTGGIITNCPIVTSHLFINKKKIDMLNINCWVVVSALKAEQAVMLCQELLQNRTQQCRATSLAIVICIS